MTDDDLEPRLRAALRDAAGQAPVPANVEQRVLASTYGQPIGRRRPAWLLPVVNAAVVVLVLAAVVGGVLLVRGGSSKHSNIPPALPVTSAPAPSSAPPSSPVPSSSAAPTTSPSATAPVGPAGGAVPAGFVPYSSTWISASDGWVLGDAPCSKAPCTSVVRTRDGGKTWVGIPAPVATLQTSSGGSGQVGQIRFADALDGWAFGSALYATHDGGATWVKQSLGSDGSGARVTSLESSGGQAWAAVNACPSASTGSCAQTVSIYRSTVGADGWKLVGAPLSSAGRNGQLVVQGDNWWLLTDVVWHGIGGNAPISALAPCAPAPGLFVAALAVSDATHLDALCAGSGAAGSSQQQLVGTTDGGHTWKPAGSAHLGPDDIAGIADSEHGVLLVAASSGGSVVTRTTNDGASFATVLNDSLGGGTPWTDLGFTTAQQATVVLIGRALYLSPDAGATWTAVTF